MTTPNASERMSEERLAEIKRLYLWPTGRAANNIVDELLEEVTALRTELARTVEDGEVAEALRVLRLEPRNSFYDIIADLLTRLSLERGELTSDCRRLNEQRIRAIDENVYLCRKRLDYAEAALAQALEALEALYPPHRARETSCWCPLYLDVDRFGHGYACQKVNAALSTLTKAKP